MACAGRVAVRCYVVPCDRHEKRCTLKMGLIHGGHLPDESERLSDRRCFIPCFFGFFLVHGYTPNCRTDHGPVNTGISYGESLALFVVGLSGASVIRWYSLRDGVV